MLVLGCLMYWCPVVRLSTRTLVARDAMTAFNTWLPTRRDRDGLGQSKGAAHAHANKNKAHRPTFIALRLRMFPRADMPAAHECQQRPSQLKVLTRTPTKKHPWAYCYPTRIKDRTWPHPHSPTRVQLGTLPLAMAEDSSNVNVLTAIFGSQFRRHFAASRRRFVRTSLLVGFVAACSCDKKWPQHATATNAKNILHHRVGRRTSWYLPLPTLQRHLGCTQPCLQHRDEASAFRIATNT